MAAKANVSLPVVVVVSLVNGLYEEGAHTPPCTRQSMPPRPA
jgi:hypothetical protein